VEITNDEKILSDNENLTLRKVLIFSSVEDGDTSLGHQLRKLDVQFDTEHDLPTALKRLLSEDYQALFSDWTGHNLSGLHIIDLAKTHGRKFPMYGYIRTDAPSTNCLSFKIAADGQFLFNASESNPITALLFGLHMRQGVSRWMKKVSEVFHRQRSILASYKDSKVHPVLIVEAPGSASVSLTQIAHDSGSRKEHPFMVADCEPNSDFKIKGKLSRIESDRRIQNMAQNLESMLGEGLGGTVYFKGIEKLPLDYQDVLASIIEKGYCTTVASGERVPFNGLIVFSTTDLPEKLVENNKLSTHLRGVIDGNIVYVPSIMDYKEDIPEIADVFVSVMAKNLKDNRNMTLTKDARNIIATHNWSRNIVELYRTLSRAVMQTRGKKIKPEALGLISYVKVDSKERESKRQLQNMLTKYNGNIKKVSEIYGVSRPTIYDWMNKYNIPKGYGKIKKEGK